MFPITDMLPFTVPFAYGIPEGGWEKRCRAYLTILDSMTDEELENPRILNKSRVLRIARGSGHPVTTVHEFLAEFRRLVGHPLPYCVRPRKFACRFPNPDATHEENFNKLLKQMGGTEGLNKLMKQLGNQPSSLSGAL